MKRVIIVSGIFILLCLWAIVAICVYTKDNERVKLYQKENNRYDSLYMEACNVFNRDNADYTAITRIREQFPDKPFIKHIKSIDSLIEQAKANNIPYQKELKEAKKTIFLGFRMGMTRPEYNEVWQRNIRNGNIQPYDNQYKYMEFGNTRVTVYDGKDLITVPNYYLFAEFRYSPVFRNGKLQKWTIVLWSGFKDRNLPYTSNSEIIYKAINKQFPDMQYTMTENKCIWSDENIEISLSMRSVPNGVYGNDLTYVIEYLNKD